MENVVKIKYAYEGLIYLPLFIAQKLHYFPSHVEIKYGGGDKECIDSLLKADHLASEDHCDIAICDPFYHPDFEALKQQARAIKSNTDIKILACLIRNSPMWIYRTDPAIKNIGTLDELVKPDLIDNIRCYNKPNTGYLFGEELQRRFEKKGIKAKPQLKDISFTPKDERPIGDREILITANVVKVAKNPKNVIYSYATKKDKSSPHLRNLFFTGIITTTNYLDKHVIEVMQVIDAIKRGVQTLLDDVNKLEDNPQKRELVNLLSGYQHVDGYTEEQLNQLFDNIVDILRDSEIYSKDLSFTKTSWDKMSSLRSQGIDGQKKISFYKYADLRLLKMASNWSNYVSVPLGYRLYRIFNNQFFTFLSEIWKVFSRSGIIVLGGLGFGVYNFIKLPKEASPDMLMNAAGVVLLLILGINTLRAFIRKRRFGEPVHEHHTLLSFCEIIVLAGLFVIAHPYLESSNHKVTHPPANRVEIHKKAE